MPNILVACTGSVATIKLPVLINSLREKYKTLKQKVEVKVVLTECAKNFVTFEELPANLEVFTDSSEWAAWKKRGDPILHIDLGKWADVLVVAPLDANTLGKISSGICDNLVTCTVRAWDVTKPLFFCPAMNTKMYIHPITSEQITKLERWGYMLIPVVAKTLVCGDTGLGAMAEVDTIVQRIVDFFT